jgi:hypothetical protein
MSVRLIYYTDFMCLREYEVKPINWTQRRFKFNFTSYCSSDHVLCINIVTNFAPRKSPAKTVRYFINLTITVIIKHRTEWKLVSTA